MPSKVTRWIPAALVAVVAVAAAVVVPMAADAAPALPEKSPEQLLAFIADSSSAQYSGSVQQRSDLGLPDLSSLGSIHGGGSGADSAASTAVELLTGSQTARVFVGGADTARIQVTDTLAERDVIRNGSEAWTYDSKTNAVQHFTATADHSPEAGVTRTPAELATQLLATIDNSTTTSVTETARVAGRSVYQLVLTPKGGSTLVGSVVLSVDSETGLPLEVRVFAAGQSNAAFSVGFTSIQFGAQDASLFSFTPPAGATVTEQQQGEHPAAGTEVGTNASGAARPTVTGEGWGSIVQLPAGSASGILDSPQSGAIAQLLTPVGGGQALQTSLLSVLVTADGRVFAGAVGIEQLQAAAAQ